MILPRKTVIYCFFTVCFVLLFLQNILCLPQRSSSIQGRYIRPSSSEDKDYVKCSRCSEDRSRYDEDDRYRSDGEPKYRSKDDRDVIEEYKPKPKDGYPPNPDSSYDRESKPLDPDLSHGRNSKPLNPDSSYDREDKPLSRDDRKPKPPVRIGYNSKPIDPEGYDTKPATDTEYKPKPPIVTDDDIKPPLPSYIKPVIIDEDKPTSPDRNYKPRDEYEAKPHIRVDFPKPVREEFEHRPIDDFKPKPPVRVDYNSKPSIRDEYEPKPAVIDDFEPKPPVRVDYNSKPSIRDEYEPKPAVIDDFEPKPPVRDNKPVRDEYKPPPVIDDYKPKPPVRVNYNPRPLPRDDYDSKPIRNSRPKPSRGGYNRKPVEEYIPKPPSEDYPPSGGGGGYHSGYPVKKDEDYKMPSGAYDNKKDDDYNDYSKEDDNKGRPLPIAEEDNCICVPYYQCTDGHIVTDGAGIIDARRRRQPDDELPLDGKFKPPSCGPFHVCCNTPESSTVKPYEHRCGVRNPSGINSRILSPSNKGEADFGEWPWQAAVLKSEGTVNIFQCGGVLIDKFHVLTVAHCVFHLYKYHDYPLKVRLGEWDTQTVGEFLAHEDYKVSKITIHPEYRNTSLWNDIAILRLQDPVLFAPHIDTVCLPKYDEIFAGQNCVVTGWGKDSYKGGHFSNVMKEVALQVIDNYGCEEMLRKTRLGRFFQLHEGFVCAGGEHGLDSCKGDGGGPLVCYRKDRSYALAGLVSWGIDCGQPGVPGVYVKVQKYLDWISKNTGVDVQDYWPKH